MDQGSAYRRRHIHRSPGVLGPNPERTHPTVSKPGVLFEAPAGCTVEPSAGAHRWDASTAHQENGPLAQSFMALPKTRGYIMGAGY